MTDIEIAKKYKKEDIYNIGTKLNIDEKEMMLYGRYMAKINIKDIDENKIKNSNLILVTSMTPQKRGEGKTTVSIGISDSLNLIGKQSTVVLREPSMGPVFGLKGGATGGGHAQIVPMENINLNFTGDLHAITASINLLASMIDNHIYHGNELNIDINNILFNRAVDINDRALRDVNVKIRKNVIRNDNYVITVASEVMAIFCLAKNIYDLKERLGNIIIAKDIKGNNIYAKDLKAEGAMAVILKDAINPNLVQTLFNNPAIIHGGPFANIAHGCNSIIATKLAMSLSNYVVTEAGFGSDLGAEKFLNIKCKEAGIYPKAVVLVANISTIKEFGDLKNGANNLFTHYNNLRSFGVPVIIGINLNKDDKKEDLDYIKKECEKRNIPIEFVKSYFEGQEGATEIAKKLIEIIEKSNKINDEFKKSIKQNIEYTYNLNDDIFTKIEKLNNRIYHADKIIIDEKVKDKLKEIDKKYKDMYICMAKSPYSITSNDKKEITELIIKDAKVYNGAKFIVLYTDKIPTMPGLPKIPNAEQIDITNEGEIIGLF